MTLSRPISAPIPVEVPRAPGFIVTIYGDVVEPRGGRLWMGTLIAACTAHGISESLVRTAVSRLVGAGRLVGERAGRRSYYALTPAARAEFQRAAEVLYGPWILAEGWRLALGPLAEPLPEFWVRIGPEAALAPDRADLASLPGEMRVAGDAALAEFAARHWPLAEVAEAYARFLDLARALPAPGDGAAALAARLRLVHAYRHAALKDPRLPQSALPGDWPGWEARRRFREGYLALAAAADAHVGAHFEDGSGYLPEATAATRARLDRLREE